MFSVFKLRCFYLIFIVVFLSSCSTTTEVQLYTEYLSRAEQNFISKILEDQNFSVVYIDRPIPIGIKHTTLIYSPLSGGDVNVESLAEIISNTPHGRPQLELTGKENHFYTKNVVGLYIVPGNVVPDKAEAIRSAYAIEYGGKCETVDASLDLKEDGSLRLTSYIWDDEKQAEYSASLKGQWAYTNKTIFITLESDEPVAFSVVRLEDDDSRSGLEAVGIKLLNNGDAPFYDSCNFSHMGWVY